MNDTPTSAWTACHCCGLFQQLPMPKPGYHRTCARCHASFGSGLAEPQAAFALATAALFLFVIAQFYPLMGLEMEGISHNTRIGGGVAGLADHDLSPLALLVFGVAIAAPLCRIMAMIFVLGCLHLHYHSRYLIAVFKLCERLRAWAMLDVFLLGSLVALTKLRDLAHIDIGIGFWALSLVVLALAILDATFDRRAIWDALSAPPILEAPPDPATWISCQACELIQEPGKAGNRCGRCGSDLHRRKPGSISRTWALVITGIILYIPANFYPVLTIISFGHGTPSTIMNGVMQLLTGNDWPLAIIVFIASIAFPLLKLLGLSGLIISVRMRSQVLLTGRTRLYRIMEFVGRWSTIDVFVAALLTALVTLGSIASVEPGIGALAFGAVVVVTMLAVESFDPRLLWDAAQARHA